MCIQVRSLQQPPRLSGISDEFVSQFHLSDNLTQPPIAELGNNNTGCVLRIHSGLSDQADRQEVLNSLVIATVALQSRAFVGLA